MVSYTYAVKHIDTIAPSVVVEFWDFAYNHRIINYRYLFFRFVSGKSLLAGVFRTSNDERKNTQLHQLFS